jgi:hypothetical protein
MSFQELADEAFRDLLKKRHRPIDLRAALRARVCRTLAVSEAERSVPRTDGRRPQTAGV